MSLTPEKLQEIRQHAYASLQTKGYPDLRATTIVLLDEIERYRKALKEIDHKASSYGLAVPLVRVCKRIAREALKGDETA